MNRGLFPTLLLVAGLFGVAIFYNEVAQRPFHAILTFTKSAYFDTVESIEATFNEHFYQKETIKTLTQQLKTYKSEHLLLLQLQNEHKNLLKANESDLILDANVELVRVLSYAKFGDDRKLLLQMDDFNRSRTYGLVYNEQAAGIVVSSNQQPVALLNGDPKCSYAVFVGDKNAPGIIHANNSKNLVVKFIPTWIPIHKGDEVITSGLDNLFFYGLKVGRVLSVTLSEGYQSAEIQPYYLPDQPDYFHLIKQYVPNQAPL